MHLFFFVLGSIVGSFLGLVIVRLPQNENFIWGRSRCDDCLTVLKPSELIPIVSYLMRQGRCRYCKEKIRSRTLYIEILTGFLFLISYHQLLCSFDLLIALIFNSLLMTLSVLDLDTMLIDNRFQMMILLLGIIVSFKDPTNIKSQCLGALMVSLPYLILALLTRGIGGGDVKLSFTAGFLLGFPKVIVGFVIAILIAGFHGIYLMKMKRMSLKSALPFAPYLSIGFFIALLYGQSIAWWYLQFLI